MNARELWLHQAAQVVVERSQDGKVPGPPSTATKLAFTCKFILTNKQKPVQTSRQRYLPIVFIEFRYPNIELRNADDRYVPARKMASVKRFPFFSFRND
jgi:hypothetical protein